MDPTEEITLSELATWLRRRLGLVATCVLAGGVVAASFGWLRPPLYRQRVAVELGWRGPGNPTLPVDSYVNTLKVRHRTAIRDERLRPLPRIRKVRREAPDLVLVEFEAHDPDRLVRYRDATTREVLAELRRGFYEPVLARQREELDLIASRLAQMDAELAELERSPPSVRDAAARLLWLEEWGRIRVERYALIRRQLDLRHQLTLLAERPPRIRAIDLEPRPQGASLPLLIAAGGLCGFVVGILVTVTLERRRSAFA